MNHKKKKCGIVTFHSSHNYGSVLQAYALVTTLGKLGLDAEIIDFRHPHTTDIYEWRLWSPYKNWKWNLKDLILKGILRQGKKRERKFRQFIDNLLPKSRPVLGCGDVKEDYDVLICGSDQIWNPHASGENDPMYFLQFGNTECKFSYAASSGSSRFGNENHCQTEKWLQSLKSIGVRESFTQDYIAKTFNLKTTVNPDPTFLLDASEYEKIEIPYMGLPIKFLLVYSLVEREKTAKFATQVGIRKKLPVIMICNENAGFAIPGITRMLTDVSPQQFLWLFHHATFIITNTFHGNMFSVIYRKDFVEYCKWKKNDPRVDTLHQSIGLGKSRYINEVEEIDGIAHITYDEAKISKFRNTGVDYLRENIF